MMAAGASGVVSVLSNALPAAVVDLVKAAGSGDFAAARKQHYQLLPLFKACFLDPNPTPIKKYVTRMHRKPGTAHHICLQSHAAVWSAALRRCATAPHAHGTRHGAGCCGRLQGARARLWHELLMCQMRDRCTLSLWTHAAARLTVAVPPSTRKHLYVGGQRLSTGLGRSSHPLQPAW